MYCKLCGEYSGRYKYCKNCYNKLYENEDENESDCIICGNESYGYQFCKACYNKLKDCYFLVEINDFGELELVDKSNYPNYSKCIICNEEANGYNFCPSCHKKYRNKSITIKINNCQNKEILNVDYSGKKYITEDGHITKSKAEREIDNYFFNKGIKHAYEKELSIQNVFGEKIELHPDFCLFKGKEKIYIEYWGFDETNESYTMIKEQKLKLYEKAGITLINFYEETDGENITSALEYKLANYKEGKINY